LQSETSYNQEDQLLHLAREGDIPAFGQIVVLYQKKVYGFILSMARRLDVADDLTQETFLKAWKALPRFKGESKFQTWLFQIALNEVRTWGRRPKRFFLFSQLGEEDRGSDPWDQQPDKHPSADPSVAADRADLSQRLCKAMDQLSSREKEMVVLKHVQGLMIREVASITGAAEGTVKAHLFRASEKMRDFLEKSDG
jgi:RNA polymerase sigma-70 factor (ECF subfamily)